MTEKENFKYCFFDNNTARTGKDVALDDRDKGQYDKTPFVYSFTSSNDKHRLYHGLPCNSSYKPSWLPTGTLNRYISLDGKDEDNNMCMNPANPCKTIEYAMELKVEEVTNYILMKNEYIKEINETLILNEKDKITLKGLNENEINPTITTSNTFCEVLGYFECSSFKISTTNLTNTIFKIKISTNVLGTLIFKNMKIKGKIKK